MVVMVLLAATAWLKSLGLFSTQDSPATFLARFLAFSVGPFIVWLYLHKGYLRLHHRLLAVLLGLFDYAYTAPERLELFPHAFDMFNLVAFASLVMATRFLPWEKKVRPMAVGLPLLVIVHFAFRLSQVLFLQYHAAKALTAFIAPIILNEWILPFVLWLTVAREDIVVRPSERSVLSAGSTKNEATNTPG